IERHCSCRSLQGKLAPRLENLRRLRADAERNWESGNGNSQGREEAERPRPRARRLVARINQQVHGGRPRPLDSSPLSPQRKTAPCARPARRKDDVFRQVSWLAGRNPSSPSQALLCKAQWQTEEGLAADSCGGSSGFASPQNGEPHRIPFWPINATGAPERERWKKPLRFLSTPRNSFPCKV